MFPESIAMDFIFEFAIIGWVFAKLRLINGNIDLSLPMIALFCYVNYNEKYKDEIRETVFLLRFT